MQIEPQDGRCRECKGTLTIIDAEEDRMTVECNDCGEEYQVETDAFGDGAMHYHPIFLANQLKGGDEC